MEIMEWVTLAKAEDTPTDDSNSSEEDDDSSQRVLGVGIAVFIIAFFLLLMILCCAAASTCRRGACCVRSCSLVMFLVVILVIYIASQQPEAPSHAETKGYDENIRPQIAVTVITIASTLAALLCVCGNYVLVPIKGAHINDPFAARHPR